MVTTTIPHDRAVIDYGFVLLTYVVCADQQIHCQESQALREIASQVSASEATLQEMEKIFQQSPDQLSLEEIAQKVPVGQRSETLRQVMAIAYIDGYFSPLERETVDQIAMLWGIHDYEIEQMLEEAQGFGQWRNDSDADSTEVDLSVGARLLKGAESVLSRSLVSKLTDLAPERIGQQIERLQREILLSGPEYDDAIQRCAKVAREDYQYSDQSLRITFSTLRDLGNGIQHGIHDIKQKTSGRGQQQTAKAVADQLEQTRRNLSSEILHDLEVVREALRAKQRALNHFSIAFMGRTKAGKSTLHAVITGEGWDAIGVGKLRTTRYNRVYEWKNIRIIDTPGIGAPGGKTDEDIARSVVEEADVICYVVTDDSITETEFEFLKVLKKKTKPLVILLNIKYNLRDARRLEHFLKNPDRWFTLEGNSGIGGHLKRIRRYAQQHYANDYLDVIPAMLLAAQLAREPEYEKHTRSLFRASHIQDFLDSIRTSLIKYGTIRRSQTLLGSTVGEIETPHQWIAQQAIAYVGLAEQLQTQQQSLMQQLRVAERDSKEKLQQEIREIFQSAFNVVTSFAEDQWESNEQSLNQGWKQKLKSLSFETRLETASQKASQDFQSDVREALEEIGNELKLIHTLKNHSFRFVEQDSSFFDKDFVRIGGMVLVAAGAALAFIFPPLGLLSLVGGFTSWFANQFKSRDQKRHEAVENISASLRQQLEEQQSQVLRDTTETFEKYCKSISVGVDHYFEELIEGIGAIATQLQTAQGKLSSAANYLNRAYAKRIVDWATNHEESLSDIAISKKIRKVNRSFGRSFQIETTTALPLTKSPDEICSVLQEHVSIQSVKH